MSLVTRCPKCQSDFVVSLEQLRAHEGLVRCGQCKHIFDGGAALVSSLPTLTSLASATKLVEPTRAAAAQHTEPTPDLQPIGQPAVLRHRERLVTTPIHTPQEPETIERIDFIPDYRSEPTISVQGEARLRSDGLVAGRTPPEFLAEDEANAGLKTVIWGFASFFALVFLLIQLAYIYRNDLATSIPWLRPALNTMCESLKCEVSLNRHLDRITIDGSSLEQPSELQAQGRPASMTLAFSMRNRLLQPQPWPHLLIELKDASNTPVVRKRLAPNDYLPAQFKDKPFLANQELNLRLPIEVTGLQITGFQITRYFP
jgi:predicted Zn finger-like uncharacterized protein